MASTISAGSGGVTVTMIGGGSASALRYRNEAAASAVIADTAADLAAPLLDYTAELTALGAITADITTVAGISASVVTVAAISADVTAVSAIAADVIRVADEFDASEASALAAIEAAEDAILTPVTGTLAVAEAAALLAISDEGDTQVALVQSTPGFDTLYPNAYATALPREVSGYTSLVAGSGGTNGTFALGVAGGSITGVEGTFTVSGGALTAITITNGGLGSGTTPPTLSFTASSGLTGASATAVVSPKVATTGRYLALSADGDSFQLYQNDGTSTPAAIVGGVLPTKAFVDEMNRRVMTAVSPSSGVVTIDAALGDFFSVTVSEDVTEWVFSNLEDGKGERLIIALMNRGFDVTWPASFTWEEGVAPTLGEAYTSDTITICSMDAGETWRASVSAATNIGGDPHLVAALALNPVWLYDHKDITSFYTDTAMTTQAAVGDVVRAVRDKSGNGNHRTAGATTGGILRQTGDLYYLESDGVDDYMVTSAINLTATDAVTLCLGFRKITDATIGIVFESSSTLGNNGTFGILAPPGAGAGSIRAASRGTATTDCAATSAAPVTNVVTLVSDISTPSVAIRLNGAASATSTATQGTGNYSNTPHYFWRRGGSTFPARVYDFGGALYSSALSGANLALVEAFVTDRTVLPITYPSGFTWSGGPTIATNGEEYTTTFDIDAMRPTTSVTYYVDPVAGSDANDGLTTGTPRAKLSTTVTLANAGGVAAKFLCKPGVYRGDVGWNGSAPTVDFILEPWATDATDPANKMWFILPALPDPFVYDVGAGLPGFRCTGFYATDPWAVLDQYVLDDNGLPRKYEQAASYAAYLATPGTWWRETTGTYANRLFVRPFDDRDLRALSLLSLPHQIEVLTTGGGSNLRFDATTNLTMWVQNACFIDGSNTVWIKDGTSGLTMTVYMKDCAAAGGVLGDGMSFHALLAGSTMRAYLKRCGSAYNVADGFDYRADPAVPTAAAYFFEDECFTERNGYDSGGANNASTAHGQSTGISLNCTYVDGQNRVINDIETSKRWMLGCTVGTSLSTDATGVTVQAGSASGSHTAKIWLTGCTVAESESSAVYSSTGCTVSYQNTDLAGLTLDGAGSIVPF